jgi:hypothetical protein
VSPELDLNSFLFAMSASAVSFSWGDDGPEKEKKAAGGVTWDGCDVTGITAGQVN